LTEQQQLMQTEAEVNSGIECDLNDYQQFLHSEFLHSGDGSLYSSSSAQIRLKRQLGLSFCDSWQSSPDP